MWRPERERYLSIVIEEFPNLNVEIFGGYWKDRCMDKKLKACCKDGLILGRPLGQYFNNSMINLNVIDDTNYPAANMRFFEIPTAGGLQLTSACPEQESIFEQRKHCVYFNDEASLVEEIKWILDHKNECNEIRKNGFDLIRNGNTYIQRLQSIMEHLRSEEL